MYSIVVLDGEALNPGDLDWNELKKLGKCYIYENSNPIEAKNRVKNADIIVTNKVVINKEILDNAPKLKYIVVSATGYNNIDIEECKKRNILCSNVPAYSTESVAQQVFAYILAFATKIYEYNESVKKGDWEKAANFTYSIAQTFEIANKTIGIIGFGNIGQRVAEIAKAFKMKVLVYTRTKKENNFVSFVTLDELLKQSDIISIHTPLTEDTKNLISYNEIKKMKPNVILINTARGGIINEKDLANALKEHKIAYAGIDVLSKEPPDKNELIHLPNTIVTPHRAWATIDARKRLYNTIIENIKSFIVGHPINLIT